jgi:hypothetical protein
VLQNGEYDQAEHLAQEGLIQARQAVPTSRRSASIVWDRRRVADQDTEAYRYHHLAMRTAWETEQLPPVLDGVIGMAELELKRGQPQSAGQLLAFVIQHPSTCARDRDRARRLFVQLESQLAPEAIALAQKQQLGTVVEKIFTSNFYQ